jgi:hypothetical protein
MSVVIITYPSRCKHCLHRTGEKNSKGRYQSFCEIKKEFIRLKDKACDDFKL